MGHQPITIDYLYQTTYKNFCENLLKVSALRLMGRPFYVNTKFVRNRRNAKFDAFVTENIVKTPVVHSYSPSLLKKYDIDAVIVGSDQVWKPRYNYETLPEMFLSFVKSSSILRVGYAVSFGSNQWEYSEEQTQMARQLVSCFDAVSVRETDAVNLCEKNLGITPEDVLDPTLLIGCEYYESLCRNVGRIHHGDYLFAYLLDADDSKKSEVRRISKNLHLPVVWWDGGGTIPQWLSHFRDSSYVVTDSFHGTVFSIIFERPYMSLGNEGRGQSRFESLFHKSAQLDFWRERSRSFLVRALC